MRIHQITSRCRVSHIRTFDQRAVHNHTGARNVGLEADSIGQTEFPRQLPLKILPNLHRFHQLLQTNRLQALHQIDPRPFQLRQHCGLARQSLKHNGEDDVLENEVAPALNVSRGRMLAIRTLIAPRGRAMTLATLATARTAMPS